MKILYLDLDTLRADHLGCYGYHRNTSPNIDRIAREGVRFTNYYCSDAPCLPSRAALMTGRSGIHTGVMNHSDTTADLRLEGPGRGFRDRLATEAFAASLNKAGFKTVSISPFAERHSAWWSYAGFSEMHNTGKCGMESAEEVTPTVLKWIEQNAAEDNWFLHVNYWDAHGPYRAPKEFGNPFENDPPPPWLTEEVLAEHRKFAGPYSAHEVIVFDTDFGPGTDWPRNPGEMKDLNDIKGLFDGYDCGIRYMDGYIGRLFASLEAQGILDDVAIIISADHGESMGELGVYQVHGCADQATCQIPMIVRWPGGKAGHVDTGLHYNLDLAPTLSELLGKPPMPSWDGQSYAPAVLEGAECGRPSLVISQCALTCQRGVRFGPWLYIRTYHDGIHLYPDEMLFNIEEDPHEQRDLAETRPELCREAVYILNQWHDDMMKTMPYDTDPLWTVMKEGGPAHARGDLRTYCERLKATGRGDAIEELKRRHPGEFAF